MKICFPVDENKGLASKLHGRFGSASMFLLVDSETGTFQELYGMSSRGGSPFDFDGIDAEAIVIGNIGERALFELIRSGLKVYQAQKPTVTENIELIKQSELIELSAASLKDKASARAGKGRGGGMGAGRCAGRGKGHGGGHRAGHGNGHGAKSGARQGGCC